MRTWYSRCGPMFSITGPRPLVGVVWITYTCHRSMSLHASRMSARVTFGSSAMKLLVGTVVLLESRQTGHGALFCHRQVSLRGVLADDVWIIVAGLARGH